MRGAQVCAGDDRWTVDSQWAGGLLRVLLAPALVFGFQLRLGFLQLLGVDRLKTESRGALSNTCRNLRQVPLRAAGQNATLHLMRSVQTRSVTDETQPRLQLASS